MTNGPDQHPALGHAEEEISLVEIANAVLRNWRVLLVLPFVLAVTVGVRGFTGERSYEASASFVPQGAEGRSGGGAAALAQQFGVSLGADRPGQSPQFYADLLRSTTLLRKAVEAEYELPGEDGSLRRTTLLAYWGLGEVGGTAQWRQGTDMLRGALSTEVNPLTGVVRLRVSSAHPVVAEKIAHKLLELLNEFNLEVRRNRAQEESRFITERRREAEADLLSAERSLQEFLRRNREFRNSPELAFEHDRIQRQVTMRQEVYTSLLRSQEQARMEGVRDTPLFTVIDNPAGTAEAQSRGTLVSAAVAFILGLLLATLVAVVAEVARHHRNAADPGYLELQRLARETWRDVRNPARWFK